MRQNLTFLAAIMLSAGAMSVAAKADLIPGGWLQPPRIPDAQPPAEAAPPPAEPAAAEPVLVSPPRPAAEPATVQPLPSPKVTRPVVHRHAPPRPARPPSDGKVQF